MDTTLQKSRQGTSRDEEGSHQSSSCEPESIIFVGYIFSEQYDLLVWRTRETKSFAISKASFTPSSVGSIRG